MFWLKQYVKDNVIKGLRIPPWRGPRRAWVGVPAFAVFALVFGLGTGLFRWHPAPLLWVPILLVILFFSPSMLEELLFRGLMIPRRSFNQRGKKASVPILLSTLLYVSWHPLGSLYGPGDRSIFADWRFLLIVALLGLTCAYSYRASGSLWVPILIHWVTVLIWVCFLGGHTIILARLS